MTSSVKRPAGTDAQLWRARLPPVRSNCWLDGNVPDVCV
jgi:hypothetical protein